MPNIIALFVDAKSIPEFIGPTRHGHMFWGAVITYGIIFPISLPRTVNALRYASAFGVFCVIYLAIAIFVIFWADDRLVPSPLENFKEANLFTVR